MYKSRQKRLMNYMQTDMNVDVVLIISPINIYYYTGFLSNPHERFFVLVVDVKRHKTTLFLPSLDETAARQVANVNECIPISDGENAYETFYHQLGHVRSFALEKSYVTVEQYEKFSSYYPDVAIMNIEPFIRAERLKKSPSEIEHVRKAIEITENGLENTLQKIRVGINELEVKAELEYQLTVLGAQGLAFDTTVLSGENSALPHGSAGVRSIQNGDYLLFDFGVHINRYCSDITRTFIIGDGTEKQVDIYETVLAANERAIEQVKVGELLKNIDLKAREVITARQYGEYFTHRVGHGLGLEIHEEPSIHHENEGTIEPGLLFTIEPGIYVPEIGGVRIEDNVYVNEAGKVEVLTSFPKELTYIPI